MCSVVSLATSRSLCCALGNMVGWRKPNTPLGAMCLQEFYAVHRPHEPYLGSRLPRIDGDVSSASLSAAPASLPTPYSRFVAQYDERDARSFPAEKWNAGGQGDGLFGLQAYRLRFECPIEGLQDFEIQPDWEIVDS